MSCLITLNDINFSYNLEPVFEKINFSINSGEKVAIVGHNGSGKSTLLHILSGKISEFSGERAVKKGLLFEIVEQYLEKDLENFTLLEALLDKIPKEEKELRAYEAEQLLLDLFFAEKDFSTLVRNLSGGGQNRLMFARSIINSPDLVFMDEPTNHLDLKSLLFLEDYINTKAKFAIVLVSHDKSFIRNVTKKTIILRDKTSYTFNLGFDQALAELAQADENAKKRLEAEEKEIDRIRKSAKRIMEWARTYDNEKFAKKAKSMERRADKLDAEKTFVTRGNPYELELNFEPINSKFALQVENEEIFYGDEKREDESNILFTVGSFSIKKGEKVALLGDNGTGKSTFIDFIVRAINSGRHDESFRTAPKLKLGLYDQEQLLLEGRNSIKSEIQRHTQVDDNKAKHTLIQAGFGYDRHDVLVDTLSGGEKSRIIFCILKLNSPNFLILDEPTNHIDLDGKEELICSVKGSQITALITGHDRCFLEEVADRYVMIFDGKLVELMESSEFYDSLRSSGQNSEVTILDNKQLLSTEQFEEDEILEKILELERLLSEDQQRKAKFQKPHLQEKWSQELSKLYKLVK